MAVVSDIEIRLAADIARLRNDMQEARREVNTSLGSINSAIEKTKGMFAALGLGAAAVKFAHMIKETIDAVDALVDLSARVSISVEDLAGLSYGAKLSGTQLEAVAESISKLTLHMGKDGDAFRRLGLTAKEPLENFKALADIFKELKDPQQRAAFAAETLGKSWQNSAILLNEGSAGIEALMKKGKELSGITEQTAKEAADLNDKLDELDATMKGLHNRMAAEMVPAFNKVTENILLAYKESGKLEAAWVALGALGAFAFTNEFSSATVKIKDLREEMQGLQADLEMRTKAPMVGFVGRALFGYSDKQLAQKMAETKAGIADLQAQIDKPALDAKLAADTAKANAASDAAAAKVAADKAATFLKDKELQEAAKKAAAEAAAAAKKQSEAYMGLLESIRAKNTEGQQEIEQYGALSESQKTEIKINSDIAAGKLVLTAERRKNIDAILAELSATEELLKSQAAQKQVTQAIAESTAARDEEADSLALNYKLYGKSADVRAIELVAVQAQTNTERQLAALRKAGLPVSDRLIKQLEEEEKARTLVSQAVLGQNKALAYAEQLKEENRAFSLEFIADDKKRAQAQLAIDAEMWEERIKLAGDGTEAQKRLREEYNTWYANQQARSGLAQEKELWASIDKTAHDTFVSIANGGKDAATRLKDTFKNVFFDWLYSMTIKKWIVNVSGSFDSSSAGGLSSFIGAAGGSSGGGGSAMGMGSLLQTGKGIYDAMAGGVGASFGTALAGFGNIIGSSTVSAFGTGMGLTAAQATEAAAAYNAAGMASTGSSISAGAAVGPYVGAAAGIAGGYMAGHAISGEYGKRPIVNYSTAIGAGIGAFYGGPVGAGIGGFIGGIIGGGLNRAFGMGKKKIQEQGIQGMLEGNTLTGNTYANWTQKGGWFRSNKSGTDRGAIDPAVQNAFADSYASIRAITGALASALGADTSGLASRAQAVNLKLGNDAAANEKTITDFFQSVANSIAAELVPGLTAFKKEGEQLTDTLQRVVAEYSAVDLILATIGKTGQEAFGSVGLASLAARERLITLAGGIDALASGTAYFAQNFLTPAEQMAPILANVQNQLASLGMAGVKTNEDFKNAVLGLASSGGLASETGASLYVQLLQLAPQFKQMTEYTEALAAAERELASQRRALEIQIMELSGNAAGALAARRVDELAAMDASLRPLQQRIYALQDEATRLAALKAAAGSAYDTLQRSIDAQKKALQDAYTASAKAIKASIDSASVSLEKLTNLSAGLRNAINGMMAPGQETANRAQAQAAVMAAVAVARAGGPLPELAQLQQSLNVLAQPAAAMFSSFEDYQKDFYRNALALSDLAELSDAAASVEQRSLAALQDQADTLDLLYADEIARLDKISEWGRLQIDAMNKVDNSVLSVAQAIASLTSALTAAGTVPTALAFGLSDAPTFGQAPDGSTAATYTPFTAATMPAPDNRAVEERLESIDRALFAIARNTGRSADKLDDFDRNGLPETRDEVTA